MTEPRTFFIIEASHLFRAGDKFQTQFFVLDVVNYLRREYFANGTFKVIVLHGSVKEEQAVRYSAALERHSVKVIRMRPIPSEADPNKVYYKPTWYLHKMMGSEIPVGSNVVLIGFHNPRYTTFVAKYHHEYKISVAAFTTPSRKQGWMGIPGEFKPYINLALNLDSCVNDIKAEFKRQSQ